MFPIKTAFEEMLESIQDCFDAGYRKEVFEALDEEIEEAHRTLRQARIWKMETEIWESQLQSLRSLQRRLRTES